MADREIRTAAGADSIRPTIEYVYDGWYAGKPSIDWEHFVDTVEIRGDITSGRIDLGPTMNSPAIRRIKAIVKELRNQA